MDLTIYSRNIFGIPFKKLFRRLLGLSHQIDQINPDVVMLQEFVTSLFLPFFYRQLNQYHFYYQNNGFFARGGLLFMIKKNLKIADFQFTRFDNLGPKYNLHLVDHLTTRGFQSLLLPKYQLCLINTHLLSIYITRIHYSPIQLSQVSQINQFINSQNFPCFLAGDFNFIPTTPPYSQLLKNSPLIDISQNLDASAMTRKKYRRKLDYAFLQKSKIKVTQIHYLEDPTFLSDHRGFLIKLSLPTIGKDHQK